MSYRAHRAAAAVVAILVWTCLGVTAAQEAGTTQTPAQSAVGSDNTSSVSLRITSPLGRTGLSGKVRIVAQVHVPSGASISPVQFFVDTALVGSADAAPYAVDWIDENPFEAREIVVQTADWSATPRVPRSATVLGPGSSRCHAG